MVGTELMRTDAVKFRIYTIDDRKEMISPTAGQLNFKIETPPFQAAKSGVKKGNNYGIKDNQRTGGNIFSSITPVHAMQVGCQARGQKPFIKANHSSVREAIPCIQKKGCCCIEKKD